MDIGYKHVILVFVPSPKVQGLCKGPGAVLSTLGADIPLCEVQKLYAQRLHETEEYKRACANPH